ncbi:MAG: hypothetical protein ACRENP_17275, partial [Longimicrobiales bacterium]
YQVHRYQVHRRSAQEIQERLRVECPIVQLDFMAGMMGWLAKRVPVSHIEIWPGYAAVLARQPQFSPHNPHDVI